MARQRFGGAPGSSGLATRSQSVIGRTSRPRVTVVDRTAASVRNRALFLAALNGPRGPLAARAGDGSPVLSARSATASSRRVFYAASSAGPRLPWPALYSYPHRDGDRTRDRTVARPSRVCSRARLSIGGVALVVRTAGRFTITPVGAVSPVRVVELSLYYLVAHARFRAAEALFFFCVWVSAAASLSILARGVVTDRCTARRPVAPAVAVRLGTASVRLDVRRVAPVGPSRHCGLLTVEVLAPSCWRPVSRRSCGDPWLGGAGIAIGAVIAAVAQDGGTRAGSAMTATGVRLLGAPCVALRSSPSASARCFTAMRRWGGTPHAFCGKRRRSTRARKPEGPGGDHRGAEDVPR